MREGVQSHHEPDRVETVSWRLAVILSIRKLRRSFRGAHGGSAPPPSTVSVIPGQIFSRKFVNVNYVCL